MMLHHMNNNQV